MQSNLNIGTVRKNPKHWIRLRDTFTSSESVSSSKPTGSSSLTKSPNSHSGKNMKKTQNVSSIQPICACWCHRVSGSDLLAEKYFVQNIAAEACADPTSIECIDLEKNALLRLLPMPAVNLGPCWSTLTLQVFRMVALMRRLSILLHKRGLGLMISCLETLVDKKYLRTYRTCPQEFATAFLLAFLSWVFPRLFAPAFRARFSVCTALATHPVDVKVHLTLRS